MQQVELLIKAAEQMPEQRTAVQESEAGLEEDKHEIPLSEKTEEDLSGKARPDSQMVSPVRMDD